VRKIWPASSVWSYRLKPSICSAHEMTDSQFHLLTPFSNSLTTARASPGWDDSGLNLTTHRNLVYSHSLICLHVVHRKNVPFSVPSWNWTHLLYEVVDGRIRKALSLNSAYRPDVLTALRVILLSLSRKSAWNTPLPFSCMPLRIAFSVAIRILLTHAHNVGSWNYEPRNEYFDSWIHHL
jgi:hypothetical protein